MVFNLHQWWFISSWPALRTDFKTWNRNYYLLPAHHSLPRLSEGGGKREKKIEGERERGEVGRDSSLFLFSFFFSLCKTTRAPIQFARHAELSLSLSNALTGKAVTSHTVIWSQSALKLFIGLILHTFTTTRTPHHTQRPQESQLTHLVSPLSCPLSC